MKHIAWRIPQQEIVKLNVDGRNLVIGDLCMNSNGFWPFGFVRKLDKGSILKAEVHAILTGFQAVWEFGCRSLILESNSLLAIHKVTCELHSKDPLYKKLFSCQEFFIRN